MIRHVPQRMEVISFFGFLSIVNCAIGLLLFVLVGVTLVSFWGAEQVILETESSKGGQPGFGRTYIECRSSGLVIHPEQAETPRENLEDSARWLETPFGECLGKLASGQKEGSLFFLVRKDGLPTYRKALGYAFQAGGGTADAVREGQARFSLGYQMVTMPGPIRVVQEAGAATP